MALPGSSGEVLEGFWAENIDCPIIFIHFDGLGIENMLLESPGTCFEAVRTPRARALGRHKAFQGVFGRLQELVWRFQGALGRLQEVLEGFWSENIDSSLVFKVLEGVGPPKPRLFKEKHQGQGQTVKPSSTWVRNPHSHTCAERDGK